jgi:hypothetical protein
MTRRTLGIGEVFLVSDIGATVSVGYNSRRHVLLLYTRRLARSYLWVTEVENVHVSEKRGTIGTLKVDAFELRISTAVTGARAAFRLAYAAFHTSTNNPKDIELT